MAHSFYFDALCPPSTLNATKVESLLSCLESSGFASQSRSAERLQSGHVDLWAELSDRSAEISVTVRRFDDTPDRGDPRFKWDPPQYDLVEITTSMQNMQEPNKQFAAFWKSLPRLFSSIGGIYGIGGSERMIGPGFTKRRLHLKTERFEENGHLPAIAGFVILARANADGPITSLAEAAHIPGCSLTDENGVALLECSDFPLVMPDERWSRLLRWGFDVNASNLGSRRSEMPQSARSTTAIEPTDTIFVYSEYGVGGVDRVVPDPGEDRWMLSCRGREEYPLLRWLDWYGYTYFRANQFEGLLLELEAISQEQTESSQIAVIQKVIELVKRARQDNHSVVAFVGRK